MKILGLKGLFSEANLLLEFQANLWVDFGVYGTLEIFLLIVYKVTIKKLLNLELRDLCIS